MEYRDYEDKRAHMEHLDDGRKTIVAFITGLLIGGLLLLVFSGDPGPRKPSAREISVSACVEKDGIPIIDGNNRLVDCKKI